MLPRPHSPTERLASGSRRPKRRCVSSLWSGVRLSGLPCSGAPDGPPRSESLKLVEDLWLNVIIMVSVRALTRPVQVRLGGAAHSWRVSAVLDY